MHGRRRQQAPPRAPHQPSWMQHHWNGGALIFFLLIFQHQPLFAPRTFASAASIFSRGGEHRNPSHSRKIATSDDAVRDSFSPSMAPTIAASAAEDDDDDDDDDNFSDAKMEEEIEDDDDGLIGKNPKYEEPSKHDDENDEHSEDLSDADDAVEKKKKESRFAIARALNPRRSTSLPRRVARFVKQHKMGLILLAFVYAFRWELLSLLWRSMTVPVIHPETGKELKRVFLWNPTSILKIVFFVMLVWKLQNLNNGDSLSPSTVLFLGRLTGNNGIALLLSSFLTPSNPAYLPPVKQHYTFETLNHRYNKDHMALTKAVQEGSGENLGIRLVLPHNFTMNATTIPREMAEQIIRSSLAKQTMLSRRQKQQQQQHYNSTVIVLDWTHLDSGVSRMDEMKDEVSFLLHEYRSMTTTSSSSSSSTLQSPLSSFELVILLQSPGGSAADYALAAQQLLRLRRAGVNVTCCVDKVAASGGYMIGCCANRLYAAPFAVLGSIGVYSESVNLHRLLEGWGVQSLTFRGGRGKAPLSLIGEVTKEGVRKVQDMIDDTHRAFKRHVVESRPSLEDRIEDIAQGDIWLGYDAIEKDLIDRIITSDEYIGELMQSGARVLKLCRIVRHGLFSRPSASNTQTATTKSNSNRLLGDHLSVLSLLEEFRSLLDRASASLNSVLANNDRLDLSALTQASGLSSQVQAASSQSNHPSTSVM